DDQRRAIGLCRYGRDERSKEQSQSKAGCSDQGGEAGPPTRFNSRRRFNERARRSCSDGRRKAGAESVDQHRPLDLGQVSIFVQKSSASREADESSHSVNKSHDEDRQHNGKSAPGERAVKIELPENRPQAGREAQEMARRRSYLENKRNHGGNQNPQEDR